MKLFMYPKEVYWCLKSHGTILYVQPSCAHKDSKGWWFYHPESYLLRELKGKMNVMVLKSISDARMGEFIWVCINHPPTRTYHFLWFRDLHPHLSHSLVPFKIILCSATFVGDFFFCVVLMSNLRGCFQFSLSWILVVSLQQMLWDIRAAKL